jgi:C1A family cysteine protease
VSAIQLVQRPVLGYIPDILDARDKNFSLVRSKMLGLAGAVTDEYHIPEFTPISDQLSIGSCVANAWADALEILVGIQDPTKVTQLSRLFLYWITRCVAGNQKKDSGTSPRTAAQQLSKVGICDEARWPYDISKVFISPPLECMEVASDNMISAFYSITSSGTEKLDDFETALRANHPIPLGVDAGDTFFNYLKGTVAAYPKVIAGGHCIIITGVRKYSDGSRDFCIRNSWSKEWGDNGHAWIDENYAMSAYDPWVATNMKELTL